MSPALLATVTDLVSRLEPALVREDERTITHQLGIAAIPAPTHGEAARGRHVARELAALGYTPRIDDVGNVIASTDPDNDRPPVVVCAHLDTVFPADVAHVIRQVGDRFVGPGIGDNARGLAGLLTIARVLRELAIPTVHPILLTATVGEEGEGDLRGARHLFATAATDALAAIALDGAGDERIVTHAVGTRRFRVTYRGPGGHSWAAGDTPNPVHAAADLATGVARLPRPVTPRTTIAVTRLHGGDAVNAIAGSATVDVELRSLGAGTLAVAEDEFRRLVAGALDTENARDPRHERPLTVAIEVTSDRPAGATPPDAAVVRATVAATEAIRRFPEVASASTDANIPMSRGIPSVGIGAGGAGGDTHTTHEWFANRAGALGLARALAAILTTAGLA